MRFRARIRFRFLIKIFSRSRFCADHDFNSARAAREKFVFGLCR